MSGLNLHFPRRLVRLWRLFWRGPAFLVLTLAAWLPLFVLKPFLARRYPTWRKVRSGIMRRWGRACLAVLGCRVTVRGAPPAPPCLLVSNHISYIDILVLAAHSPARFVSKAEIADWPLAGTVCRTVDILFVDRGRRRDVTRVADQIAEALEAGDPVILFPEGTSTPGDAVATLKPSLLAPAAARQLPVHWAVVRYETPDDEDPAFLSVAWWGEMPLTPHAPELLKLGRIEAELEFGEGPFRHPDRKELARRLRERMAAAFRPMVSSGEAAASTSDRRFP
ncbi:MAG: 1-acyl-sn-glycerol-3-phosphate acyltransferase [Holophagales bacterium]|nr:1-acyl-sn-glycerol-3-phosphate acyltransferase [Holophagales bacterium]MYC10628.1 1-acyl-sn-glycerol-3-phosphate acyltransferase [Holophagales bacterium]